MLRNAPMPEPGPAPRAWLPCDAPQRVGDDGCPACGAMLLYSSAAYDREEPGRAPNVPDLFRAHCARGFLATRMLRADLFHGGQLCDWRGWIQLVDGQIRVIGHGHDRPEAWLDPSGGRASAPRPAPLQPFIPNRDALIAGIVDLHQRTRALRREVHHHFDAALRVNVPDPIQIAFARLEQLAQVLVQRADAGAFEALMADLKAQQAER